MIEQHTIATEERLRTAKMLAELRSQGLSTRKIQAATGLDRNYTWRLLKAWDKLQASGNLASFAPGKPTGRPAKFVLTEDEANVLRGLVMVRGSKALAIEEFRNHEVCRMETRVAICEELDRAARDRRMPRWPLSVRRACHVSAEEQALFRGKKHAQQFDPITRRDHFIELKNGTPFWYGPGDVFESDDMSLNEPFRVEDPLTGEVFLRRQTLFSQDVYSLFWLGASPLGRARDAYRLEDIADHVRSVVETHGLPMVWRFEKGVWCNSFIDGVKIDDEDTHWGGLGELFRVEHVSTSRAKGSIESSFNLLQNFTAHMSLSIGRKRGEFEEATRLMLRANNGDREAAMRFWSIAQAADGILQAMQAFHLRPKERAGAPFLGQAIPPHDLFQDHKKREVPASEAWRFLPVKTTAIMRGGHVELRADHYDRIFRFLVHGVSEKKYISQGDRLLVAFHPGKPEEGCHVFWGEPLSSIRNRDRMPLGEFLCVAPLAENAPQVSYAGLPPEFAARKKAGRAQVTKQFRAAMPAGRKHVWSAETRDGQGNRIEAGNQTLTGETRTNLVNGENTPRGAGDISGEGIAPRRAATRTDYSADDLASLEAAEAELIAAEGII
jgi:hypothetical protein